MNIGGKSAFRAPGFKNPGITVFGSNRKTPVCLCMADFDYMKPVAADRLVALTANYDLLVSLQTSVALLSFVIVQCGNQSECRFSYPEAAEILGKSLGTIKNWSNRLQEQEVVDVSSSNQGVVVKLNEDLIVQHGFAREEQQEHKKVEESIQCITRFFYMSMKQDMDEALQ
jgi:hypothetical protein